MAKTGIPLGFTRKDFAKVSWLAKELGMKTVTGSDGHRIVGSRKQYNDLTTVISGMHVRIKGYTRVYNKLVNFTSGI